MDRTEKTPFLFHSSREAWAFVRVCDANLLTVGYPSLCEPYTVQVLPTDREHAKKLYRAMFAEAAHA